MYDFDDYTDDRYSEFDEEYERARLVHRARMETEYRATGYWPAKEVDDKEMGRLNTHRDMHLL